MSILFDKDLNRLNLLSLKEETPSKKLKIMVYRNHNFELVATVLNKFLNFSKINAEFIYSDYDDSMSFSSILNDADINLVWIDICRYKDINIHSWLKERINYLKSVSEARILVYTIGEINLTNDFPQDIIIANSKNIEKYLKNNFLDLAKEEYSGTRLSSKASLYIARELGLKYITSMFMQPLKAIITDLDNTLYQGVLGEDGIDNLIPDYDYQKLLKELKEQGFFIAVSSKNEIEDVKEMFKKRKDFLIKWDDFAAHSINWDSKAEGIRYIAKKLNVGFDSIIFIDDNIGEIQWVKNEILEIKYLLADEDIAYKLSVFPGLYKSAFLKEDKFRTEDIKANLERQNLFISTGKSDYFRQLEMKLEYLINPQNCIERISQLLNKTNQFIFSYKRYSEKEVKTIMEDSNSAILTVSLSDKLSESGIIGIIVAQKGKENSLLIKELCVSCRALGRHIEDIMLKKGFQFLKEKLKTNDSIMLEFKYGPRNNPAKNWIEKNFNCIVNNDGLIRVNLLYDKINTDGIKIILR